MATPANIDNAAVEKIFVMFAPLLFALVRRHAIIVFMVVIPIPGVNASNIEAWLSRLHKLWTAKRLCRGYSLVWSWKVAPSIPPLGLLTSYFCCLSPFFQLGFVVRQS